MAHGLGLGKERTRLGRFLDQNRLTQEAIRTVSMDTMTRICSDPNYKPTQMTMRRVVHGLIKLGYDVTESDFW